MTHSIFSSPGWLDSLASASSENKATTIPAKNRLQKGRREKAWHKGPVTSYPPLESVSRPAVDTAAAAYYLLRQQQTLRGWVCHENGPLRPFYINGRLARPAAHIRRILGAAN